MYKNLNPEFHETLTYGGISLKDLDSKTLRLKNDFYKFIYYYYYHRLTVLDEDRIGFDYIGEFRRVYLFVNYIFIWSDVIVYT